MIVFFMKMHRKNNFNFYGKSQVFDVRYSLLETHFLNEKLDFLPDSAIR
jgi:hypothetical protein